MLNGQVRVALVATAALLVAGCRIDLNLDDKGGGTGVFAYRLQKAWELASQKKNLESVFVKVTDAQVDKDKLATFKIAFDDVTRLNSTQAFKTLSIKRTVADGVVKLEGMVNTTNPIKLPQKGVEYFGPDVTITVTVPGDIVDGNQKSKEGRSATWVFPLNDLLSAKNVPLTLSYKQP